LFSFYQILLNYFPISFVEQFVFASNNNINQFALFAIKRQVAFEVQIWYNTSKSNRCVNNYIAYIAIQIFALKRSLSNIILFANNRNSLDIQTLFANNNNIETRFKSNYLQLKRSFSLASRLCIFIYLFFLISILTQFIYRFDCLQRQFTFLSLLSQITLLKDLKSNNIFDNKLNTNNNFKNVFKYKIFDNKKLSFL